MEFSKAEGADVVNGTWVNHPKGVLQSPVTDEVDDVRAFGALQYVASGAADGFAAANPADRLIDLVQSLRAPYRQGAAFVMNSATLARIPKFKPSAGAFLWPPGLVAEPPESPLGIPVVGAGF